MYWLRLGTLPKRTKDERISIFASYSEINEADFFIKTLVPILTVKLQSLSD